MWVGIGAGIAATLVGPLLGLAAGRVARLSALSAGLSLVGFVVPLVAGIVLAAMQGPPQRRGVGLGLIIGWALAPIIFAGACIVILIAAYSQTGS